MDPVSGFGLFIAGKAVLPHTYARGIDWLLHRSNAERLAKDVKELTGHRTGRYFRQWYEREEAWHLLVAQGQESYEALVDSLSVSLAKRLWGKPHQTAVEEIVQATIGLFVCSLMPAEAVAVEGHRSAARDATHDSAEAARHERTREELRNLGQRLDAANDLPARVEYLPPGVRRRLLEAPDPAVALHLINLVDVDDPKPAVAALTRPVPDWLAQAAPVLVLAAAELALAYQVPDATKQLFELAAELGLERGYCTARLALQHELGDRVAAHALLEALPAPRGTHADATAAVLADDFETFATLVTADAASDDPLLTSLWLHYLREIGAATDDIIAFLTGTVQRQTEAPGLLISLADLHHERSRQPSATSRAGDRAHARNLLIEARDLRRRWRGDSAEPVAAACRLALAHGDFERAVRLGSEPPEGEALPREAASTETRHAVGVAHAGLGSVEVTAAAVEPGGDDFGAAILRADVLACAKADSGSVVAAYEAAWLLAATDRERHQVWLGASAAGLTSPPGVDDLANEAPEFQALVAGQAALATGRPHDAVAALKPFPMSEPNVRMLAYALADLGDVDEAIAVLKSAADRFNDPAEHLTHAVRILRGTERIAEAGRLGAEALQVVPAVEREARDTLHEVAFVAACSEQLWGEAARLMRAWIADIGSTPQKRWSLAFALYYNGDNDAAWAALREAPVVEPTNASEAQLWIVLAADQAPGPDTAEQMLAIVDRFSDSPDVAHSFVSSFMFMRDDCGEVNALVIRRFQELLDEHAVEHAGGSEMSAPIVRITGTPEQQLEQMQFHLQGRATAIGEMLERVRDGYPYGLITLVGGRPYTSALIHRAAGYLPIATTDADRAADERDAARKALRSRTVVVDPSTLVVGSHLGPVWTSLRDRFRLEVPSPARRDILRAEGELTDTRAGGSIYYDTDLGRVRVSDVDADVAAKLADIARWIMAELPHFA